MQIVVGMLPVGLWCGVTPMIVYMSFRMLVHLYLILLFIVIAERPHGHRRGPHRALVHRKSSFMLEQVRVVLVSCLCGHARYCASRCNFSAVADVLVLVLFGRSCMLSHVRVRGYC